MNTGGQAPRHNDLGSISITQQSNGSHATSPNPLLGGTFGGRNLNWGPNVWTTGRRGNGTNDTNVRASRDGNSWSLNDRTAPGAQSQRANSTTGTLESQQPSTFRFDSKPWADPPPGGLSRAQEPPRRPSSILDESWTSNGRSDLSRQLDLGASRAVGSSISNSQNRLGPSTAGRIPPPLQLGNLPANGINTSGPTSAGSDRYGNGLGSNIARDSTLRELADSAVSFSPADERRDPLQFGGVGSLRELPGRNGRPSQFGAFQDLGVPRQSFDQRHNSNGHPQQSLGRLQPQNTQEGQRGQASAGGVSLISTENFSPEYPDSFARLRIANEDDEGTRNDTQSDIQSLQTGSLPVYRPTVRRSNGSGNIPTNNGLQFQPPGMSDLVWSGRIADARALSRRDYIEQDNAWYDPSLRTALPLLPNNGGDARRLYLGDPIPRNNGVQGSQFGIYPGESDALTQWSNNTERRQLFQEQRELLYRQQQLQMQMAQIAGPFSQHLPLGYPPAQDVSYMPPSQPVMPSRQMPPEPEPHQYRSRVLEEFRNNVKSNRRYELKDFKGHLVEFSGDREGSKFIQTKLETASSEERAGVFNELLPNALPIMTDIFGNYVIQKFFEYGDQTQKKILADKMKGHVYSLSTQIYGCRVVQTALEHILVDQQVELVSELKGFREGQLTVIKCVKDQNGNHVIQRAIECVPHEHIGFIIESFIGQIQHLATHDYGCRVVQRVLEHCGEPTRTKVMQELFACASTLISDKFGNYVTQHVIEHGRQDDRDRLIAMVMRHLIPYSRQKCASNVVESCIKFGSQEQRHNIMVQICQRGEHGESALPFLIKDAYANYVIQSLLDFLPPVDNKYFADLLRPEVAKHRRATPNKQLDMVSNLRIIAVEKRLFADLPVRSKIAAKLGQIDAHSTPLNGFRPGYSPTSSTMANDDSTAAGGGNVHGVNGTHGNYNQGFSTASGAQDPALKVDRI